MLPLLVHAVAAQEAPPLVNAPATDAYPAVVTLLAVDDAGEGENFCSGTLVASRWVLTAAHCLLRMAEYRRTATPNLVVAAGYDLGRDDGVQAIVGTVGEHLPDDYDAASFHDDVGLVELADDVAGVDPMPVREDGPTDCERGEDLRYVGWGTVADDAVDTSVKRAADIPLYDYDDAFLYGYDPEDGQNACGGDSGGAALVVLGDGRYALAGVDAYVSDDDDTPCVGGYTASTRVDRQIAWIERYTPVVAGEPPPACAEAADAEGATGCAVPTPGRAWTGIVLAALATARRGRGRRAT